MSIPKEMKAIRVHEFGGPDVVAYDTVAVPELGDTQVLVKMEYGGLNFMDQYFRAGFVPVPLPYVMGFEGAGEVVQTGSKVTAFKLGDKVTACKSQVFQQYVTFEQAEIGITKLPPNVTTKDAAAGVLQGVTAWGVITQAYKVKKGDVVFVHAAAGGTGSLVVQIAKHFGATVIGSTSSEEKVEFAKQNGCDHVINYKTEDPVERVKEITNGKLCDVVCDAVGPAVWETTKGVARNRGTIVSFGSSSGPDKPFSPLELHDKSLTFARVNMWTYLTSRKEWDQPCDELMNWLSTGAVKVRVSKVYEFGQFNEALEALASGKSVGKLLLQF